MILFQTGPIITEQQQPPGPSLGLEHFIEQRTLSTSQLYEKLAFWL